MRLRQSMNIIHVVHCSVYLTKSKDRSDVRVETYDK